MKEIKETFFTSGLRLKDPAVYFFVTFAYLDFLKSYLNLLNCFYIPAH